MYVRASKEETYTEFDKLPNETKFAQKGDIVDICFAEVGVGGNHGSLKRLNYVTNIPVEKVTKNTITVVINNIEQTLYKTSQRKPFKIYKINDKEI